jgi:hypothetical protein
MRNRSIVFGLAAAVTLAALVPVSAQLRLDRPPETFRIATFNASLNRFNAGDLIADLQNPASGQPSRVAEIIQRTNPDVILINEFDFDSGGVAARLFVDNFLAVGQNGAEPWVPVAIFSAPSNTGVPTGIDLDRDGNPAGPGDAYGFGYFPGQYGMLILSKYPIVEDEIRAFQNFLWRDMPGALLPDDPETPAPADYYSPEILDIFRLSSKSHWDVPVEIDGEIIHILASHPTPPVFDGPEDRNGTRNHDEVRFWLDYVTPGAGGYIYDDAGNAGGVAAGARFVILGDLNLDPNDGDAMREIGRTLLGHPSLRDSAPVSQGAVEDNATDGGFNANHAGDPAFDTADFGDGEFGPGNLRADYVLPSANLGLAGAGVFWPTADDPLAALLGPDDAQTSDHRLVWIDVTLD